MHKSRDELLKQLTILDFMALDIALYLDTHPDHREAIKDYNEINVQACKVRRLYESLYGPICSFRSMSKDEWWSWIDKPWPWDRELNFQF